MSEPQPVPVSRTDQLMDSLPWTLENMLLFARARIEERGDVSVEFVYHLSCALISDEARAFEEGVRVLRVEHFAKLGVPVPEMRPPLTPLR